MLQLQSTLQLCSRNRKKKEVGRSNLGVAVDVAAYPIVPANVRQQIGRCIRNFVIRRYKNTILATKHTSSHLLTDT